MRERILDATTLPFVGSALRLALAASLASLLLGMSACGGGGDSGSFSVGVQIGGQPSGDYGPGSSQTVYVRVGESFELDASEPVIWTLYVAGTAFSGSGTAIHYAGADITLTEESPSRVAVDTFAAFPLRDPIPMTLVATSTFDAAQVATVNVLITN